jgi:diguanylate cyclase (GGDEF)-like protein/PAS domain S-box-containing protein
MRNETIKPFVVENRHTIAVAWVVLALFGVANITVSFWATRRPQHGTPLIEVAARQAVLADRYAESVLLVRTGSRADPATIEVLLERNAQVLLAGGTAAGVDGSAGDVAVPAAPPSARPQLRKARSLIVNLTKTGRALLAARPDQPKARDRGLVQRLRVLAARTSSTSLDAARTIGAHNDSSVASTAAVQVALGVAGLIASMLLVFALVTIVRRQSAEFRTLVASSTDLVLVIGFDGCTYASPSVSRMVGVPVVGLLGDGFRQRVHREDRAMFAAACAHGEPRELVFRVTTPFGEWRSLEAHLTDLRNDRRVRGVVLNARDVSDRLKLEGELTRQAFRDSLTGLANRALFRDRLDQMIARVARSHEPFALLIIDLDGFKQVNDSFGHEAGDTLLQEVARRFHETTRPEDTLARLGGDEFALILEGADERAATSTAGRLLRSLSEPVAIADQGLRVSASIGISLHARGKGESSELVRNADLAMYAAKEAGRGRYELFQDEMTRGLGELIGIEHELRQGIQRGEFVLYYQPEFDLATRALTGCEALVRWTSPTRGHVMPGRFVPVAESTGLIVLLGEHVLREACRQTEEWRTEGLLPDDFATWVNVSGRQLSAGHFVMRVRKALEESGLPPAFLGLEITETAIVGKGDVGERAKADLRTLRELGIRIALDDFGTGVSTLAQLRTFPVDMIKLDRSFVQGVGFDPKDAAISASVIGLGRQLGLTTIAEGIETQQQLRTLREFGCDHGQGYLFARPGPPTQMRQALTDSQRARTERDELTRGTSLLEG